VASAIEANPSFIAAEKNYTYAVDPIGSLNAFGNVGSSSMYTVVQFGLYSNQRISPCGGSSWTLLKLGNIQVNVPVNPDGSRNLSSIAITSMFSTAGVQFFSCTTYITSIPSQTG
jgi:hypothetical protein